MKNWEDLGREKILSCPFCGGTEGDIARTNANACWVECCGCGGKTESRKHRGAAIALWNIRHTANVLAVIAYDMDAEYVARPAPSGESKGEGR